MRHARLLPACLMLVACGGGQSTGSTTAASTPAGHTFHDVVLLPDSGAFVFTGEPRPVEGPPQGAHVFDDVAERALIEGASVAEPQTFAIALADQDACVGQGTRHATLYWAQHEGMPFTVEGLIVPSCGAEVDEADSSGLAVAGPNVAHVRLTGVPWPEIPTEMPNAYTIRSRGGDEMTVAHPNGSEGVCYMGPTHITAGDVVNVEVESGAAVVTGLLAVGDETFIRYDACATRGIVRIDGAHVFSGDNPFVAYCEC